MVTVIANEWLDHHAKNWLVEPYVSGPLMWNSQKLHIGCEQGELQCPSKLDVGCNGSHCRHLSERSTGNPTYGHIIVINRGIRGIFGGARGKIYWNYGLYGGIMSM
ncbi:hypothetical protein TSUD_249770 [Trifolium subterraneum]|nr:hypothetical protein TSUD_249770 [Trifolium subterraneum]